MLKTFNRLHTAIRRIIEKFYHRWIQARRTLEKDAVLYRAIFESCKIIRVLINPDDGRIVDVNQAAADFYGYAREALSQKTIWDFGMQTSEEMLALLARLKNSQDSSAGVESRHRLANGELRDVVIYFDPICYQSQVLLLAIILNITERKQMEQALSDEIRRRRTLFEQSRDGIVILDGYGKVYEANQHYADMLGYSVAEICQLHVWDWDAQWTREELLDKVKRVDLVGEQFETRHRRKDGVVIDVDVATSVTKWAGQKLILCICRDITDRKRAEQALRENEERLQRVLDGINDGFWDWNIVTGEVLFSRRWAEMLGYDTADIAPHISSWQELVHPDDLPRCQAALEHHFNGETPQYRCEHRMRMKNGAWRWILDRGKVTQRDTDGHPTWMAGAHTDIHERRHMEETLRTTLVDVRSRNVQIAAANRMDSLLLSCEAPSEAYEIIARSAEILFADHAGGLAVSTGNTAVLRLATHWGNHCVLPPTLPFDQCWALRRGELYAVTDAVHGIYCPHFLNRPTYAAFCSPLIVRGETLGLLHISAGRALFGEQLQELHNLVTKVSESAKLALSNLKLWEALREQAIRDPLTGLFNRRYLDETLPREFHRCQRNGEPLTVAMLDLDHFKRFNDDYGHEAGDTVLRVVSDLLRRSLRSGDLACRYGGEELVLLLPGATSIAAQARLEELRQAVMQLHIHCRGCELPAITVSIGLAAMRLGETDAAVLLGRADAALYQAKARGRNRVASA
ncbi:MAG: diguanylate cyclase [Gammaproteobacteria bacterium]|nr:diguanylate cyclase [Gammaproteobacteria bacterium]